MPAKSDATVVVTRLFDAPAERVFDAWLDRKHVGEWLFRTPTGAIKRVECDPRVGGGFEIFEQRGGELAEHHGTYVEIDRPRRLAFDFWTSHAAAKTRVTIEIASIGGGCAMTLTHVVDPAWAPLADRVREGWGKVADKLAAHLGVA